MKFRKNIRLKFYDYSNEGKYFITICIKDMKNLFGKIIDNNMILNENGNNIVNVISNFDNENFNIDYYQIMANHIHLIFEVKISNKYKLSQIVSRFKSKVSNALKINDLWQKGYYERVIRNDKEYLNIIKYNHYNPFKGKYKW